MARALCRLGRQLAADLERDRDRRLLAERRRTVDDYLGVTFVGARYRNEFTGQRLTVLEIVRRNLDEDDIAAAHLMARIQEAGELSVYRAASIGSEANCRTPRETR